MPIFNLELDDATYQAALSRARQSNKTVAQILSGFLTTYTDTAQLEASAPTPQTKNYAVKSGDTLSKIAQNFYGDPFKYKLIQQANNLPDTGRLFIGQVLKIPPLPNRPIPAPNTPPPMPHPSTPTLPPRPAPQPVPKSSPQPTLGPKPTPQPDSTAPVNPCAAIPAASFKILTINGNPTDRPAPNHGDLNLSLRSYKPGNEAKQLISLGGATDTRAPQLRGLFTDKRIPNFPTVYQVYNWDWAKGPQGGRGNLLTHPYKVTMLGMATTQGEVICVPNAGYSIGEGMQVLVLYATSDRVTIKYTREDNVVDGYTIHIEGICVEPQIQAAYNERDRQRNARRLVALAAGSPIGRAKGNEIAVAIRDKGTFMDPRTRKDWWRGS